MKFNFFLTTFCFLLDGQAAFSQLEGSTTPRQPVLVLEYPAIKISEELSQKLFLNSKQKVINCPVLFDKTINFYSGAAVALCDDAQLACLRYGLLVTEIQKAKEDYLEDLNKTLVFEKQEVLIRLRGCELALKKIGSGDAIEDIAGYPKSSNGL